MTNDNVVLNPNILEAIKELQSRREQFKYFSEDITDFLLELVQDINNTFLKLEDYKKAIELIQEVRSLNDIISIIDTSTNEKE